MTVTNKNGHKVEVPAGTQLDYQTYDLGDTVLHQWTTQINDEEFTYECRSRPVETTITEHNKLIERTKDAKHLIKLKMTDALTKEAIVLWQADNKSAARAIFEYLAIADDESLVRLHDIIVTAK